ncbi:MAG: alpha/beta hydrolase-fold protein [Bryobacteraceae bacterium]|nr:alpha/beta hydrolase-fold protein [Bryobacteraceae bacterium]
MIPGMALRFGWLFLAAAAFAQPNAPKPPAFAQQNALKPVVSPEVHADRRVTFRFRAPNAKEVFVAREGAPRLAMQLGEEGVWSVTTEPLPPDVYGYSFVADGVSLVDPMNPSMKTNLLNLSNMVEVRGPLPDPWTVTDVPRGALHRHFYRSGVVGDDRDYYVYTPANYNATASTRYPVLYLLHGFSDDASGWTAVGRAHVILDNLIAQGKAKPMIVVMTLGYGAPEIVTRAGTAAFRSPELVKRNYERYRDALFTEVIPAVEKSYRVAADRESRAIAGLSMGGAESLFVGLNAIDRFAWIGSFSAGGASSDYAAAYPKLDAKSAGQLRLFWVGCGTEDRLIDAHRKFVAWLKEKEIRATTIETPGAHTWMVWRRYLAEFTPLLFR